METKLKILLADDDPDDTLLIREMIRAGMGDSVSTIEPTDNADDTLKRLDADRYDLCLFDLKLGKADGLELMGSVRDKGFTMPIIVLTGFGDEEIAVKAMQAGAADYLNKTRLSQSVLTRAIRHALSHHAGEMKKRDAESTLRTQSRLLQAVSESTSRLLIHRDFSQAINEAMAVLAEAANLEIACIFQHSGGEHQEPLGRLFFKWVKSGGAGNLEQKNEELSYDVLEIEPCFKRFQTGQSVSLNIDKNSVINQKCFHVDANCSAVFHPIFTEGNYWGFVVFGDSRRQREWSENENSILKMAAASIGGKIKSYLDEETIRSIVEGTSGQLGDDFFQSLVKYLSTALPVKCAYVSEISNSHVLECRVLAGWEGGREAANGYVYLVADTPCEDVLGGLNAFYPDRIQEVFPKDTYLTRIKAKSYAGVPCFDSNLKVIGHLAVADSRPLINKDRTLSILKMFAARAGAELTRKRDEKLIKNMAYHDALTGLPNRSLLNDRMNVALAHAGRGKKMMAVLYIDFDGFKPINDTLGHAAGDRVLQQMSKRFQETLRREDTVARLGGDEFVVILNDLASPIDSGRLAQKLLDIARIPIVFDNQDLSITLSIGISLYPRDGENNSVLLKRGDEALYQAKGKGGNCFQYSSPALFNQPT